MNRAVGRRPLFEGVDDIRSFLACLVASVRRGQIRVQAFTFLTTHFHLLVESVTGDLSGALRRIESEYVARFNRRHDRDGPLVRGRYLSKLVDHDAYWTRLIRYIDDNPVAARLVNSPTLYPHGSAFHYARADGPHWLHREPVERFVSARSGVFPYDPSRYELLFDRRITEADREWIESRVRRGDRYADPFADLIGAAPAFVQKWLAERSLIADGSRPGVPVLDVGTLQAAIAATRADRPIWRVGKGKRRRNGWEVLTAGLLRSLCAESLESIARRLGMPLTTARYQLRSHADLLREDSTYRRLLDAAVGRAFDAFVDDGRTAPGTAPGSDLKWMK